MARTRKAPQMTGIFADLANEFLDYKRNAGFKYENEAKCLARLCRFSTDQGIDRVEITRTLAEAWAAPKEQESDKTRAHKITCIRQFAMFLDNLGYDAYILPEQKGLHYDSFTPYIFTHEQIRDVIRAADNTEACEIAKNMHLELPVVFRILYGCGLRVSEVVHLQYKDVHLEDGYLMIREAKQIVTA